MSRGPAILFVLVVAVSAAAGAALALGNSADPMDADFHRLVGGPATIDRDVDEGTIP
jgi:hypothetical protein